MKQNEVLERFGVLVKQEPMSCMESGLIMPNTCVLEAVMPFAGYYSEVAQPTTPYYLYLVLEGTHSLESITRATTHIARKQDSPLDAVTGTISVAGLSCQVIRIRNLPDYNHIVNLQQKYMNEGIAMKKKIRKIDHDEAVIRLRKFFYLTVAGEDMYMDASQAHHGYFVIPSSMSWEAFSQLTKEVKYHTELLFFDAATAFIYEKGGITDLVRIYKENLSNDQLAAIRKRYLMLLKKN